MKKTLLYLLIMISATSFAQLSGTYTIGGTSPDYATINDAVTALNTDGISGTVTFNIRTGTYNEQVEIGLINGVSSTNYILFKAETSTANDVVISYAPTSSADNYTILLNGAEDIRFQFVTIESTGTSGYNHAVVIDNGSMNVFFDFVNFNGVSGDGQTIDSKVPFYSSSTTENAYLRIAFCNFSGADYAFIYLMTNTGLYMDHNNLMDDLTSGDKSLYLYNLSGQTKVSRNEFVSICTFYTNNSISIHNITIEKNIFHSKAWLFLTTSDTQHSVFKNNLVLDGSIQCQEGSNVDIFHNTVYNTNNAACIWIASAATNISIKNNMLVQVGSGNGITIENLNSISSMDYNNVWKTYGALYSSGSSYNTLADWQTYSGFSANSINLYPNFIDENSDYSLCEVNNPFIGEAGLIIYDINNTTRSTTSPTIGAYESDNSFISAPDLGVDQSFCGNASVNLTAGTFSSYLWATGENTETLSVNTNTSDNYSITVTDVTGCEFSDNINIDVNSLPIVELGNDTTICNGEALTLDAGNFETFNWSTGDVNQTISISTPGLYSVTVTDVNSCENTDEINLLFGTSPTIDLGNDTVPCHGEIITFDAGVFDNYNWSNGSTDQTITVAIAGNYSVTVSNSGGCSNSDTINLSFNPLPVVNLGNDTTICDGETLTLDAGNFESYSWSTGETNQIITVSSSDMYSVSVTDANGCENNTDINVDVIVCTGINEIGETYNISVYPNPASNNIQLTISNEQLLGSTVKILDVTGKIAFSFILQRTKQSINVSDLQNGVYFLKIDNQTIKFIKN